MEESGVLFLFFDDFIFNNPDDLEELSIMNKSSPLKRMQNQRVGPSKFKVSIKNSEIPDFIELKLKETFALDFKTIQSEFTLQL